VKDWLYYLTDQDGRSYYLQNGLVKSSASPRPLTYTPDGWQDIAIAWERNMQKVGTVRNFSLPLGFVLDGATILRNIMYGKSLEEKLYLLIQKLGVSVTSTEYELLYQYFYKGELDLSTLKDEDTKMVVNIMEGALSKLIKANEGTIYEFDLSDDQAITVMMDGIYLTEKHNFVILEPDPDGIAPAEKYLIGVAPTTSEGKAFGFSSSQIMYRPHTQPVDPAASDEYFSYTAQNSDLRIVGKIRFLAQLPGNYSLKIETSLGQMLTVATIAANVAEDTVLEFDYNYTGSTDEKFFLFGEWSGSNSITQYESEFYIEYQARHKTTYTRAFPVSTLFRKLTAKITGLELNADASFLEDYDRFVLTSGDGIRSLEGAKVKTSLNHLYEFCKTVLFAGQGIEGGKLLIDDIGHFLDPSNPIHLGIAKDLKVSLATDLMANTFKVGYESKEIDDVNGKYEFNNTHLYTSPLTRVVRELAITSPYNAQPYLIEITRINLDGKTTTDDKTDNQVFVLDVAPRSFSGIEIVATTADGINYLRFYDADQHLDYFGPGSKITISGANINNSTFTVIYAINPPFSDDVLVAVEEDVVEGAVTGATVNAPHELNRPAYAITGVPDTEGIFNIDLSPKRILLKWQRWINSLFYRFDGQKLKFQTTERNADLKTVLGGVTVEEKADLALTSDRLFLPFYFEFDTEVPIDLVSLLEENANRCFSFEWLGETFTGFLIKAGIAPNTNKEQAFKLLAGPSNDMTKLI
jgi:hypothetical protein